jgi:hypothetical protein
VAATSSGVGVTIGPIASVDVGPTTGVFATIGVGAGSLSQAATTAPTNKHNPTKTHFFFNNHRSLSTIEKPVA